MVDLLPLPVGAAAADAAAADADATAVAQSLQNTRARSRSLVIIIEVAAATQRKVVARQTPPHRCRTISSRLISPHRRCRNVSSRPLACPLIQLAICACARACAHSYNEERPPPHIRPTEIPSCERLPPPPPPPPPPPLPPPPSVESLPQPVGDCRRRCSISSLAFGDAPPPQSNSSCCQRGRQRRRMRNCWRRPERRLRC